MEAGIPVAIYNGDPLLYGELIGIVETTDVLYPGGYQDLIFEWQNPPYEDSVIYVYADDDGTGFAILNECDRSNNICSLSGGIPCPNHCPIADPGPDRVVECEGDEMTSVTLIATLSHDPDGDPLSFHWAWADGVVEGAIVEIILAVGVHPIKLFVDDGECISDADLLITVVDSIPPALSPIGGVQQGDCLFEEPELYTMCIDSCDTEPFLMSTIRDVEGTECERVASAICQDSSQLESFRSISFYQGYRDCDHDGLPDCMMCDPYYDMECFKAEKAFLGSSDDDVDELVDEQIDDFNAKEFLDFGDCDDLWDEQDDEFSDNDEGPDLYPLYLNIAGTMQLSTCPLGTLDTCFDTLELEDRVKVSLDGELTIDQPLEAFDKTPDSRWIFISPWGEHPRLCLTLYCDIKSCPACVHYELRVAETDFGFIDSNDGLSLDIEIGRHFGTVTFYGVRREGRILHWNRYDPPCCPAANEGNSKKKNRNKNAPPISEEEARSSILEK